MTIGSCKSVCFSAQRFRNYEMPTDFGEDYNGFKLEFIFRRLLWCFCTENRAHDVIQMFRHSMFVKTLFFHRYVSSKNKKHAIREIFTNAFYRQVPLAEDIGSEIKAWKSPSFRCSHHKGNTERFKQFFLTTRTLSECFIADFRSSSTSK